MWEHNANNGWAKMIPYSWFSLVKTLLIQSYVLLGDLINFLES